MWGATVATLQLLGYMWCPWVQSMSSTKAESQLSVPHLATDCSISSRRGAASDGSLCKNVARHTIAWLIVSSSYCSRTAPQSGHLSTRICSLKRSVAWDFFGSFLGPLPRSSERRDRLKREREEFSPKLVALVPSAPAEKCIMAYRSHVSTGGGCWVGMDKTVPNSGSLQEIKRPCTVLSTYTVPRGGCLVGGGGAEVAQFRYHLLQFHCGQASLPCLALPIVGPQLESGCWACTGTVIQVTCATHHRHVI